MKISIQLKIACKIYLFSLAIVYPVQAQIVPDTTLPNNSTVTNLGNTRTITGGTRAGSNLFHSFSEFSIPSKGVAYFNNALDIKNIISRVTGGSVSNIDGLIRANGTANLFLINPNGFLFGPNARLNIGGSFVGSTASSLKFADGTVFSATAPKTPPLLTISVPLGLQFEPSPAQIIVQGPGAVRRDSDGLLLNREAGLRVQPNQTLALVGGDVVLEGGNLTTDGGRIELGSVTGSNLVSLTPINKGWSLGYEGVHNFRDIKLSQQAAVDASGVGGGDIQVQGRQVTLQDGSQIEASTLGAGVGGTLAVTSSESVNLSGTAPNDFASGVLASVYPGATGTGGNLTINTGKLIVRDGGFVSVGNLGLGQAGNLSVIASDSIELSGTTRDSQLPSELNSQAEAAGAAGELKIVTGKLIARDGGLVSSGTLSQGKGGDLSVIASDLIEISGAAPNGQFVSGLFTSAAGPSLAPDSPVTGAGGNLTIATGKLMLSDGGRVSAFTKGQGAAGNIQIDAKNSVSISGISLLGDFSSGLFTDNSGTGKSGNITVNTNDFRIVNSAVISAATTGEQSGGNITINANTFEAVNGGQIVTTAGGIGSAGKISLNVPNSVAFFGSDPTYADRLTQFGTEAIDNQSAASGLFANTTPGSTGKGGAIVVNSTKLTFRDGASITVNSLGKGDAGNLNFQVGTITLDRGSSLSATTTSGKGGNIFLNAQNLQLRHNSPITATAGNSGNGGNITINTGTLAALENSPITANAYQGRGGNIQINAQGIFRSPDSKITASSQLGINGTVQVNTLVNNSALAIAPLPIVTVDPAKLIAQGCPANVGPRASKFVITGSGGLPPSPSDSHTGDTTVEDWGTNTSTQAAQAAQDDRPTATTLKDPRDADPYPAQIVEATGFETNAKGEVVGIVANAPTYTPAVPWLQPTTCHPQ